MCVSTSNSARWNIYMLHDGTFTTDHASLLVVLLNSCIFMICLCNPAPSHDLVFQGMNVAPMSSVRLWDMSIDVKVPSGLRQTNLHSFQILG